MAKKQGLIWRRGRRPQELIPKIIEQSIEPIKETYVEYVQRTAGSGRGTWPVRTGMSRDEFHWDDDLLRSTDYAPRVNIDIHDNVLGKQWEEFDFTDTLQKVVDEVR